MDPRPYHYQYRKPRLQNPTFISNRLYQSIYHLGSYGKMYPNMDKLNNNQSQANLGFKINPQPRYADQYPQKQVRSNSQNDYKYRNGTNQNRNLNKNGVYVQNYVNGPIDPRQLQQHPSSNINNYESQRYQSQLQRRKNYNNERQPPTNMRYSNEGRENMEMRQAQEYPGPNYNQKPAYPHENLNGGNSERQSSQGRSYSQQASSKNSNSRQSQQKQANNYMSNYGSRLMKGMPRADQDFVFERQQKPYNIISCYPRDMYGAHRVYPKLTLQSKLIQTGQYHAGGHQNPEKY